jgi:hypothetical protein
MLTFTVEAIHNHFSPNVHQQLVVNQFFTSHHTNLSRKQSVHGILQSRDSDTRVLSHKKLIDEMFHYMRREQIKVSHVKWISAELFIALGPQAHQLLFQPMLCLFNCHFTQCWSGGAIENNGAQLDGL